MNNEKIIIFYHVYQYKGWERLFYDQINSLVISGLYHACDLIHIGINGDEELPFNLPKFKINYNINKNSESDTLKSLHDFCVYNPDYKVMYFHTKGVATDYLYITKWRYYMEYFIIHRWKDCIQALNEYDTVGTEYIFHSTLINQNTGEEETEWNPHYSGNFWWVNSSYITKLDPNYLYLEDKGWSRYRSEFWLGTGQPNPFEFYNSVHSKGDKWEYITPIDYYITSNPNES
jgi:hypothetical protein